MEIAPVISSQRFGQNHGRHLCRPQSTTAQFRQPGTLSGQRAQPAGIQHQTGRCDGARRPHYGLPNSTS